MTGWPATHEPRGGPPTAPTASPSGGVALLALSLLLGACSPGTAPPSPSVPTPDPGQKSIAFYVGRELTADGSVFLGGFGHEPSSHWLEITPARDFPPGTIQEVGITGQARLPGLRFSIPQEGRTARFITSNYSEFAGFPPPLTNGGLNEHGVAARTVWSPSRPELVALTPDPQQGLSYSDLARRVMERATTAREAAQLVGELVDAHGYATYGGNSFLFADAREGWVVLTFAGGLRLWAAERLGPGEVRVLYPGYIRDFPVDFRKSPHHMGSARLVEVAVERGWFDPESGRVMDLQAVYGLPFPGPPGEDGENPFRHPPTLEAEIRELAPVAFPDLLALVRDPRWSDDRAGYGQAARLRAQRPPELQELWVSVAPAVAAPLVPLHVGAGDVPPEYKQHRYLTRGADATFLDPAFAPLEGTRSAWYLHKRLLHLTCHRPVHFLPRVTRALEAMEAGWMEELPALETEVEPLLREHPDAARERLTRWAEERLLDALGLGEALLAEVEAETRERFGIEMPGHPVPEGASWRPESGPMMLPPGSVGPRDRQHCHDPALGPFPRRHGTR